MSYSLRSAALAAALLAFAPAAAAQGTCQTGTSSVLLDANDVSARLYNTGGLFWNGGDAQYEVPKGSGIDAIFTAGLWLGGQVDGELRTAAATYSQGAGGSYEFWPGPLSDGGAPPDDCSVFDRIYLVSQADIDAYDATGTATPDLAEWPAALGAPVADGDGDDDNYDLAAGDRPELQGAAQTAWWVMNDAGGVHGSTQSEPIQMEVRVQALSFLPGGDIPDYVGTATFYSYTLVYKGATPIREFYASFWSDADLGNFEDDYIGSVPEVSLGYTYNADDDDEGVGGYGLNPPAVGVVGVFVNEFVDVAARRSVFGAARRGGERAPLASVMYYNNEGPTDPRGNPDGAQDYYNYQRARWRDGTRMLTGADGYYDTPGAVAEAATPFAFTGAPPAFWSEYDTREIAGNQANAPGDRRSIQTFGPFTLEPGEAVEVAVGVLWARSTSAIASRDALVAQANDLQEFPATPEAVFGNSLQPLAVSARQGEATPLPISVSNPGAAVLEFDFAGGQDPAAQAFIVPVNSLLVSPGQVIDAGVSVMPPSSLAPGIYETALVVRSNDRNVVSARIPVTLTVMEPLAGEDGADGRFALAAPRPNPSAGTTRLDFETASAAPVRLSVIDVLGREVAVLVDDARAAGTHHAELDASALPAGLYLVRLRADGREATRRLTIVR